MSKWSGTSISNPFSAFHTNDDSLVPQRSTLHGLPHLHGRTVLIACGDADRGEYCSQALTLVEALA
jgi:hypothetical protein